MAGPRWREVNRETSAPDEHKMSASSTLSMRSKERGDVNRFAEAFWLAGRGIWGSWLSYLVTVLPMVLAGLIVAPTIDGSFTPEGLGDAGRELEEWYNAFFTDFFFLVFGTLLAVNWMSRDYFRVFSRDAFSERLIFMRSLPVSQGTLVGSRMVSMCFALLFTVPAFFAPVYLISDLSQLGWGFLWFVLIWIGYSLLGAGVWLLGEFGVHGRTYVWTSLAFPALLIAVIALLEWAVDFRAVDRTSALAQSHGPAAALVALILGASGFVLTARYATRRVESRDLSA